MLQEIVECNGGSSFQLSPGSSHHRKSGHKFLIPQMSPHRRSSKGTKDKGRHQRPESPNRAASPSTNTPRLSMTSCDQESASEASSSFHDSLASWPAACPRPLSPRSFRKHLQTSLKMVSFQISTKKTDRPKSPRRLAVPPPSPLKSSNQRWTETFAHSDPPTFWKCSSAV